MLTLFILLPAAAILTALTIIDLRTRLLPNKLVAPFALLGGAFHFSLTGMQSDWLNMGVGAILGGGILLAIRAIGNYIYKDDTLGLGDVKLMGAAGLWLGAQNIMLAMVIGALAGIFHGLILVLIAKIQGKKDVHLHTLSLPAGPGFIVGIVLTFLYYYKDML